jgi:hypothetical protein
MRKALAEWEALPRRIRKDASDIVIEYEIADLSQKLSKLRGIKSCSCRQKPVIGFALSKPNRETHRSRLRI